MNVGGEDYFMLVLVMGFEGWVRFEYDINVDGLMVNVCLFVVYLFLIFGDVVIVIGKGV